MQGGTWEEPQVLDKRSRQLAQAACTTLMEAMLTRSPKKDVRIATVPMRTLMVEGPRTNNTLSKLAMTTTRRRLGAMTPTTIKAQIRQETIEMLSCNKKKIGASVLQKAKGKRKKKSYERSLTRHQNGGWKQDGRPHGAPRLRVTSRV